ncbi:MAG: sugar phosphate isomerase/epimerase [Chloroflexi bacterium]|nr:sugar phosphate isomerase/epimerase [Chloroflexota bacterium]
MGRFDRLGDFLDAAASLGFTHVEFNYELPPGLLAEAKGHHDLVYTSLHNPCPKVRVANGRWGHDLSLGSPDPQERTAAVALARTTIDQAQHLGCRAVVLHMGAVTPVMELERSLHLAWAPETAANPAFLEQRQRLAEERERHAGPYVEAALRSLADLAVHARRRRVALGIETRYWYAEIPSFDEMATFLDLDADAIGYWHDAGHVEVRARIGPDTQRAWLERYGSRMLGCHLHDVQRLKDHCAAGLGDLPWDEIATWLPPQGLRTCEFAGWNEPADVGNGLALLRQHGLVS